ncbi:MAG TPA: thiamine pyrophosphate-binding protein [Vicinamibacterales bacterium]|jgi:indolepyruvate decarboxylase|nr:thiamine pyrophosphate-binding protein [Vicinamibacterales bacterium]
MKLHAFLFDHLWDAGVRQIFGIPGDFVLNLYQALEADGRFRVVRFSHEPAVGFAADGAARITGGLGICCVTYGAGGLNMVNSVGCAYAEESPLVVLTGGPGRLEKQGAALVHHAVKSFDSQLNVYREVTAYAAVLDNPRTAASHIRTAVEIAVKTKRPVYLEIPRDMVFAEIVVPPDDEHVELKVDEGALDEAVEEIVARLRTASHPVLIVGVEVHRFRLQEAIVALAERLQVPVASSFLGRGVFPTRHPQFVGTYLGVVSPPRLRAIVEGSDCLFLAGELVSDTSLGVSADTLRTAHLMIAVARDVYIGHARYQDVPLDRLMPRLLAADLPSKTLPVGIAGSELSPEVLEPFESNVPIRVKHVISVVNEFLEAHPDVPLVADTGDCLFASVDIEANEIVAPAYYATMGFAVPAALGVQVAGGRRPLVLVGDGAFQMTGPEISHAPELRCSPVVILLNNARWEMLQAFFPEAQYNATVPWPFSKLAGLWGGQGFDVRTPQQLRHALTTAWASDRFAILDVALERGDLSPILRGFVDAFKKRVYVSR